MSHPEFLEDQGKTAPIVTNIYTNGKANLPFRLNKFTILGTLCMNPKFCYFSGIFLEKHLFMPFLAWGNGFYSILFQREYCFFARFLLFDHW